MTDTVRNGSYLQNVFRAGQAEGSINSQMLRDFVVSALSVQNGVVAVGSDAGTATVLTARRNIITQSTSGAGVIVASGLEMVISNRSGMPVNVYPPLNGRHESMSPNVPIMLPDGQDAVFTCDPVAPWQCYVMWLLNLTNLPQSDPGIAGVPFLTGGIIAISQGATS